MILQGVEFPILLLTLAWALQQCITNALPVICNNDCSVFPLQPTQLWEQVANNLQH